VPNILTIPVPNPDQLLNAGAYGAGAVVQVQRAAASSGPFDDEGTVPIIAGTTSYIYYDTEGSTATWYRVRYESADGTTAVSEWGTPFQSYTSLVSLADARSRAGAAVTQAMIDGLEAELAVEIGPLTGERTETFYLERLRWPSDIDGVYLSRRTNAVTVETDGTPLVAETDYRLMAGYILDLIDTGWQGDKLAVTYTPTDTVLVREVIYDLLTFRSLPSNLQSVRIGQYSETYFPGASSPVWGAAIAKVLPASGMGLTSPFRMRRTSLHRTLITETP
jgi:hypothetical protein